MVQHRYIFTMADQ